MEKRIPLSDAALKLGLTYHQCRARVLSGGLKGGRDDFGRLYVDAKAVRTALGAGKQRRLSNPQQPEKGGADD